MLHGTVRNKVIGAMVCVTLLLSISPTVLAAEPHENPEISKPAFSGISLFNYYTDALNFVIQKEPSTVEARLVKMPFANIPQSLKGTINSFATNGISISHLVVNITEDMNRLIVLKGQFRLDEATNLADQISGNLSQAYNELDQLEQTTNTTGDTFNVFSVPANSNLRRSYDGVLDRIDKIRKMLAIYEQLLKATGLSPEQLLKATGLSMEMQPTVAFVGDNISFEGILISGEQPLAERDVNILLDGSQYVIATTDTRGHYQGRLQIPYRYVPQLILQALYYPRDKDVGLYLASVSPVIKVKVLFYEATPTVSLEDEAYPGLETTVKGSFYYGQSPPLKERRVEIYLDDVFVTEVMSREAFAQTIKIPPDADPGKHLVTVYSAPVGRYSSVVTSAVLNVTRATPVLELYTPRFTMIPGSVSLDGKLHSGISPLSKASIKIGIGKSQVALLSSEDGTFKTKIKVGMGFGLIGAEDLVIQALPQEPWNAPLNARRSILMVNVVNCSVLTVLLLTLGIYIPGRLRKRLGAYSRRVARPAVAASPLQTAPMYSRSVTAITPTGDSHETDNEPRDRILRWYRLVVRLIQGITRALLGPQQTLREFAQESSEILGPAAKNFIELTKMVERQLYSQHGATAGEVKNSEHMSRTIEEELKGEGV